MKRLRVVAGKMAFLRGTARAVCVFVFLSGVVTPLVLLLLVSNNTPDLGERWGGGRGILSRTPHERRPLDYVDTRGVEELQFQIHELEEIRASVRNELRVMDQSRIKLGREVDTLREALTRTKKELGMTKMELQDAKGKLSRASRESGRVLDMPRQTTSSPAPIVILPMQQKLPDLADIPSVSILPSEEQYSKCTYPLCFDFSKCPLTQPFFVFVYNQHFRNLFNLEHPEIVDSFVSSLHHKHSLTSDSSKACVFVAVIGPLALPLPTADEIETKLHSLPHWDKDGVNHVLIHLSTIEQTRSVLNNVATGRAVVVQNHLSTKRTFRKDFDILSPPITFTESNEPFWEGLPPHVPSWRTNLLYFQGKQVVTKGTSTVYPISAAELDSLRDALVSNNAKVVIETDCPEGVAASNALEGEWALCGTEQHRSSTCSKSTFSLSLGNGIEVGSTTYTRLIESLKCGAVPVVFGISVLPFDDVIDWRKAAILLPPGRFGDIHYIVRSMEADTILEYRRQGRFIWETFLRSPGRILDSIISIVRYKSLHPPPPALEYSGRRLITTSGNIPSIPSPTFQHNFSTYTNNFWNAPPGPFWMYPVTPFQPGPVSGTKYTGMDASTILHLPLHIVQAGGITGPHFESYLLGNSAEEQFTVVMLTYHRNEVLLEAVERLKELSFLAKVVVVWNTEDDPPTDMGWPSIGVPVEVVRAEANSLNNRFLPLSNIQTEAVLSIDDDVHLRHDEIQFAFRVWRESRDRIVGFPGRFHAWDVRHGGWLYNSNHTCELSMVLTGAAFFHKYYSYLYSYWMPQAVRDVVDHYMNCEDIAMNFLVSHITRKPPLKVTTRWTFRCPGCPDTLSTNDEHFSERHLCLNRFTEIYGYMPLLYTQFRIDSVLFKTRLPSHLEKCYQYI